ncbi:TPA: hypothetical protein ACH3X2_002145 [Trebouxia sp. C0005]
MVLIQCVYISPPCFRVFAQELAEFGNISLLTEESVKCVVSILAGPKTAAATEAEHANNEVDGVPDSPSTVQEDNSEGDSTGIDLGPTYFTDWKIEEAATQAATEQAEPAAEDTAATSAQERQQSRFRQRERKQPKQIYEAQAAMATELDDPQTNGEAMRAPDASQ